MSDEKRVVLVRVIEEGFGKGNLAVIDELVDPAVVEHQFNIVPKDREGIKECIRLLHRSFPDFNVRLHHESVDGDLVWCHFTATGTQTGQLGPFPPTGKPMQIDVFDLARVQGGRIVEHWGVPDLFAQLGQLGLLGARPAERPAGA